MAHKKAAGSAKNLRDSNPKYRGLKLAGGQTATAGNIIIRQKGDVYECGRNTYKGKDYTIHARIDGIVSFRKKKFVRFDGRKYLKTIVEVLPAESVVAAAKTEKTTKTVKAPKVETPKTEKTAKAAPKKDAPAKAAAPKKATPVKKDAGDDLTKILGVTAKVVTLLEKNSISSFADLSGSKVGDLRDMLADNKMDSVDPSDWKKQATLAKNGKWDELDALQKELKAAK